jgi:predicted sulfurtransferase
MYNNVLEQVTEFIQNSFENLSKAMSESELQSILLKLEQQVVPLINQIMEFIEEYEGKRSVRDEHFTVAMKDLTKDYAEFESLANNYLTDREKESQQLREEIVKKRKSCQEHCSREVRSIYQTNANKLPRIGLAKDVAELLR